MTDLQPDTRILRGRDDLLARLVRERERFLAEHFLSGPDRRQGVLLVQVRRRADVDCIDLRPVEQRLDALERLAAEFLGRLITPTRLDIGECDDLPDAGRRVAFGVHLAHEAVSNQSDLDHVGPPGVVASEW